MTVPIAIVNARIVDPVTGSETKGGVLCANRKIVAIGQIQVPSGARRIDAQGKIVSPGLVDAGVFAADPHACAAGGITRAVLMPDQSPVLDDPALVARATAARKPDLWVHPLAAATRGLDGLELAEIGLMKAAGAVGVATGRRWISHSGVMSRVFSYANAFDLPVVVHAEDEGLTEGTVATAGETATRLGLSAAPAIAEAMAVTRDLLLAEENGAHVHFRMLSTRAAFDLIRAAKKRGVRVTCGVSPAHLLLSETAIGAFRTYARLSPPLRSEEDRLAAIEAVRDGTVDILCSGHDPRGTDDKRLPYADAAPGMSGAETLLTLSLTLLRDGVVSLPRLIAMLSSTPAALFGLPAGQVKVGGEADLVVFDPDEPWRIDDTRMAGQAGNTPFDDLPVQGRVTATIKGGEVISR